MRYLPTIYGLVVMRWPLPATAIDPSLDSPHRKMPRNALHSQPIPTPHLAPFGIS